MRTNIIEIGLPTGNVARVQQLLAACLEETGDALIGQQSYDDQTLLVVRLFGDTVQFHLRTLSAAFRDQYIHSFQVVSCYLFKMVFNRESYQDILRSFPLHPGESWFPAWAEERTAYLCLNFSYLSQEQIAWLATQTSIAQWSKEV
jgi:hypothetical protein